MRGLIGYWPGNGDARDYSATGNHGSFHGAYAPGPTPGTLSFDLARDKVAIANNPAYAFTSYPSWTVGFRFNSNGRPLGADNGLFLGQDNGPGYRPKWFVDYGYTVFGPNNQFNFHVNDYNQERIFVSSQGISDLDGWHQLTVTIENDRNGLVSFFLDSNFIGSQEMGPYVLRTDAPLLFGQAEALSYSGLLSDVVLYDHALSQSDINQLSHVPDDLPATLTPMFLAAVVAFGPAGRHACRRQSVSA
jgi:hypothetical protein